MLTWYSHDVVQHTERGGVGGGVYLHFSLSQNLAHVIQTPQGGGGGGGGGAEMHAYLMCAVEHLL